MLWTDAASWLAAQGRTGHVAAARITSEALAEEEALRPDAPELLSTPDVAELLGVSRQRVHQLHTGHRDFPAPYARLGAGPIWARQAVEAFDRSWTRKPGRPARAAG
ncbi:MAG: helix-turn-helix domain-containing protein [Pseudonocardia sp.]|nr:helix-turn-helix domain-containing protein [Pseudonocardia sp.]